MQLSNVHPLFIGYGGKIHIVDEDAESAKPWYFCDFHDDIYELAVDLALDLIVLQGEIILGEAQRKIFLCRAHSARFFSQTRFGKLGSVRASVESIYLLVPHD